MVNNIIKEHTYIIDKYNLDKYKELIDISDDLILKFFYFQEHIPEEIQYKIDDFTILINSLIEEVISNSTLTEREKIIFRLRYDLYENKTNTLEYIGKSIGVTRERIRQILVKCNRKILWNIKKHKLNNIEGTCLDLCNIMEVFFKKNNSYKLEKLIIFFSNSINISMYVNFLDYNKIDEINLLYDKYKNNKKVYLDIQLKLARNIEQQKKIEDKVLSGLVKPKKSKIFSHEDYIKIKQNRNINKNNESNWGSFYSNKMKCDIWFESQLEEQYLLWLEKLERVIYYVVQPFKIEYVYNDESKYYHPDVFFVLDNGTGIVVEIKPFINMQIEQNFIKYNLLKEFSQNYGISVIYTDGRKSYEEYKMEDVNEELQSEILMILENSSINWVTFNYLLKKYDATYKDIIKIAIKNNLRYIKYPFNISYY